MSNNTQTPALTAQQEKTRSAAIMLALETESTFKMYSYRLISHEQFVQRIDELITIYHEQTT